jgi:hypothetical protein
MTTGFSQSNTIVAEGAGAMTSVEVGVFGRTFHVKA